MKRLTCLLAGHKWHTLTRECSRCGDVHFGLLLLDALAPLVSSAADGLTALLQAQAKLAAAQAAITRRDGERLVVQPALTPQEEIALDLGKRFPHLAHHLPQSVQKILKAEQAEAEHLYAPDTDDEDLGLDVQQ